MHRDSSDPYGTAPVAPASMLSRWKV